MPPARPAKTGTSEAGGTVAAARTSDGSRSSSATTCGTVARADSERAWPAYTPPSSGSTSRSTTSSPSRSATNAATETSSSGAGAVTSARARARPSSESTPVRASSSRSAGTPITERGSGRSAPRVQMRDEMVAGCTRSRPSERARSTASGRRLSIASAPTSTVTPATSARRSLPPTTGEPSSTSTSSPAAASSRAAASPAMPAPTTTVRRWVTRPACQTGLRDPRDVIRPGCA